MVKTILFGIVLGMSVLSIGYLLVRGNVLSRIHVGNAFTQQTEVELPVQVLRELQGMQIQDFKLDLAQSRIYDVRRSLFLAPDASLLHQDIQRHALEQTRKAALKSGILGTAEQNAVRMVKGLFSDLGYTVEVEVLPAA